MAPDALRAIIRRHLPAELHQKSGAVLCSPISTLRRGPAYLMGLNPGGHPDDCPGRIIDCWSPTDGTSPYTHECWQTKCEDSKHSRPCVHLGPDGATLESALNRHQRNAAKLHSALSAPPGAIFSANAIFGRSTRLGTLTAQSGFDARHWWRHCWPVHREFLAIVRPRMLITLGYGEHSSAFGFLRRELGAASIRQFSEQGGWAFDASIPLEGDDVLETIVIGVPHPSYHAPGPLLAERLFEVRAGILAA